MMLQRWYSAPNVAVRCTGWAKSGLVGSKSRGIGVRSAEELTLLATRAKVKPMLKVCRYCGKTFKTPRSATIYCDKKCYNADPNSKLRRITRVALVCLNCKKTFYVKSYQANLANPRHRVFCGRSCSASHNQKNGSWNKGIPHTEEEKRKISIGGKRARQGTDYVNPATRPDVRAKISKTITKLFQDPRNNPRYIDGRCGVRYPFAFNKYLKEEIRIRDNYTCQICGITQDEYLTKRTRRGLKLDVHHKDGDNHNLNPNNLTTLCRSCHVKLHDKISIINKRRKEASICPVV